MKTNKFNPRFNNFFGKVIILQSLIFILLTLPSSVISQNNKKSPFRLGAGVGAHVSGNAHGGVYDIYGSLTNGKSVFSIGACIQNRSNPICGGKASFSYVITNPDNYSKVGINDLEVDKLQLYLFSFCQYIHQSGLSSSAIQREKNLEVANEPVIDLNSLKLSTIEAGAGLGLNYKINKKLVWSNYIGISTFYHLNYNDNFHSNEIAPVLIVGTSFGINFYKK